MRSPWIEIDLSKVEHNAHTVVGLCARHGIGVAGVTKSTCGHPEVARAMLRGGVTAIGESRMENVRRLREAGIEAPLWLLRVPPLSQVEEVVESVATSEVHLALMDALHKINSHSADIARAMLSRYDSASKELSTKDPATDE